MSNTYDDLLMNIAKLQKEFEEAHKDMPSPKYVLGDVVRFSYPGGAVLEGMIAIVDRYGTFEQNEEPSYDIYRLDNNTLYKHVRESYVIDFVRHGDVGEMDDNLRLSYH